MNDDPEVLFTVSQTAERLLVKPGTVRLWANARRFDIVRLGRAIRIPEREVLRLIRENTIPAKDSGAGR